jgi:hypothetical protein
MTVEALADGLGPGGYRMLGYMVLAAFVLAVLVVVGLVWLVVWLVREARAKRRLPPNTPAQ